MSQAHARRLLSGASLIALVSAFALPSATFAAETFPAGVQAARTINADTNQIDVQSGAIILTDGDGNSITISDGVTVNNPAGAAVIINNGTLLGTFDNEGVITATGDAFFADSGSELLGGIVNNGNVTGVDGFDFENITLAEGFANSATINGSLAGGTNAAFEISNSTFAGGISNTGSMHANYGIDIQNGNVFSGGIDNRTTGSITGNGGGGIRVTGGATSFDGGIRNAGNINGGEGGIAVNVENNLFVDGITNTSSGTITGDGAIALRVAAASFSGGIQNQGNINAVGATAIHIASGAFGGTLNNSGNITSTTIGINVDAAIPGGIVTSGNITAPLAIDILSSSGGPTITQTGGLITGDIQFCDCGDSFFVGKSGRFLGDMFGTGVGDDLTVSGGGTWAAEGTADDMNNITTFNGTGVYGGRFRGDRIGTGFDVNSTDTFDTVAGRAYIDDNSSISVGTQSYGGEGALEYFLTRTNGTHGSVNSTGGASLDGRLAAYFDWNSFAGTATQTFAYTNVITSSGLVGAFDNEGAVDTNSIFFTATAAHVAGGTAVDISGHRIGFDDMVVAPTTNQAALGTALETIFVAGGANFLALEDPFGNGLQNPQTNNEGLYSALFQLGSAGAYAAALSSLDGHIHAQLAEATFNVNDLFDENIHTRLNGVHQALSGQSWSSASLDRPTRYAQAVMSANDASMRGGNPGVARGQGPWSVWAHAIVQGANFDGDANAEGFDQDIGGFGGGADYAFSPRTVAGLALQFADTEIDFDPTAVPASRADIESWQIAGYVSHGFGPIYLDAIGSATFNSYDTARFDFRGQPITADYDSTVYSIYGEVGTIFGDERGVRFQPYVGAGYRSADVDDFVETCPVTCLAVRTDDPESFYSAVGLAVSKTYQWGDKAFVPELRASWTHEFSDDLDVFQSDLLGLPGVPFQVVGTEFDPDRFNLGANATLAVSEGLELYAGYRYAFSDDMDSNTGVAGVRATW